jgi:hypothetical protein
LATPFRYQKPQPLQTSPVYQQPLLFDVDGPRMP